MENNEIPEDEKVDKGRRAVLGGVGAGGFGLLADRILGGPLSRLLKPPEAKPAASEASLSVKQSKEATQFRNLVRDNSTGNHQIDDAIAAMSEEEFKKRFHASTETANYGTSNIYSLTIPEPGQENMHLQPTITVREEIRGGVPRLVRFDGIMRHDGTLATVPMNAVNDPAADQAAVLEETKQGLQRFAPGLFTNEPWGPAVSSSELTDSRFTTEMKDATVDAQKVRGLAASNGRFHLEIYKTAA